MAIADWHGGKVALFWLIAAAVGVVLVGVGIALVDCRACEDWGEIVGAVVALGAIAGAFVSSVVVTWRWLSAREKQDD